MEIWKYQWPNGPTNRLTGLGSRTRDARDASQNVNFKSVPQNHIGNRLEGRPARNQGSEVDSIAASVFSVFHTSGWFAPATAREFWKTGRFLGRPNNTVPCVKRVKKGTICISYFALYTKPKPRSDLTIALEIEFWRILPFRKSRNGNGNYWESETSMSSQRVPRFLLKLKGNVSKKYFLRTFFFE